MIYLRFGSPRLEWEWASPLLPQVLRDVILEAAVERWLEWGEVTRITSIWRTPAENRAVGAKSQTHPEWRAVDTSVVRGAIEWEEDLRKRLSETHPTGVRSMPRVAPIRHGTAPHFHCQATRAEAASYRGRIIRW